jgi:hypothetical protein
MTSTAFPLLSAFIEPLDDRKVSEDELLVALQRSADTPSSRIGRLNSPCWPASTVSEKA